MHEVKLLLGLYLLMAVSIGQASFRWSSSTDQIQIDPWGSNSLRVRIFPSTANQIIDPPVQALLPNPPTHGSLSIDRTGQDVKIVAGNLAATVDSQGLITFSRLSDGRVLLQTAQQSFGPVLEDLGGGASSDQSNQQDYIAAAAAGQTVSATLRFNPNRGEKIYGLGEHRTGSLQNKPISINFQRSQVYSYSFGGDISIPFYVSTQGYGFLWNLPSFGYVVLNDSYTEWYSNSTFGIDYWITTNAAGNETAPFADLMRNYVDATGHPPVMPHYASGFWQSKNRYTNQTELMSIAQGYLNRSLTLSVIVIDYYHWIHFGDWSFYQHCWPNPRAMVRNLAVNGIEVMVSVWPVVENTSFNFPTMYKNGYLVKDSRGQQVQFMPPYFYDPFNSDARKFVFGRLVDGYVKFGIKTFWLDADEPQRFTPDQSGQYYYNTTLRDLQVGMAFPRMHQQMVYEGFVARKEPDIITLSRSAWAGTQRYAGAVWSGDINSTFAELAIQVKVAQNVAMSGIYWWTTDIGGYNHGNIFDPEFRELIVRWYQFGAFCPLFRTHGYRSPPQYAPCGASGGPNEVWMFGEKAYQIIPGIMRLREQLRPYIMKHMRIAAETGTPVLRPMFFDFPNQADSYQAEDQYMFGPDWLVAPVTVYRAASRNVFLPTLPPSQVWVHHYTQKVYKGGQHVVIPTPLESFPLFTRMDAM